MSNQILAHVGNIAYAISTNTPVLIPDAYILDGSQDMSKKGNTDVTPTTARYASLSDVFDTNHLLNIIRSRGIEAKLTSYIEEVHGNLECSWIKMLANTNPETASHILGAFKVR